VSRAGYVRLTQELEWPEEPWTRDEVAELKRYFEVMVERVESQTRIIAEGQTLLNEKIDRTRRSCAPRVHAESGFWPLGDAGHSSGRSAPRCGSKAIGFDGEIEGVRAELASVPSERSHTSSPKSAA